MIPTVKNFRDFLGYEVPPNDAGKGWVVNVDQKGKLSRRSWVAWGSRDEKMLKANGNARQAFVTALKNEFNVTKLSDIPKSVQQVLKIGDFELDENDSVKSVKPLTAYRIRCVTDAVERVKTREERMARVKAIVRESLTPKCAQDFVALTKAGKLGSAKELTDFISRHFGGKTGVRLEAVLVNSQDDRTRLVNTLVQMLVGHVRPALVEAGVTGGQLSGLVRAIREFPDEQEPNGLSARTVAKAFAESLHGVAAEIGHATFDACLDSQLTRMRDLPDERLAGSFSENMKTERGRDLLLRAAVDGLSGANAPGSPDGRIRFNSLLSYLADHVKELGSARAYVLTYHLRSLISAGDQDRHMQARQLLGAMLKRSTNLTDADIKQLPVTKLLDYALAAADDSLVEDRTVLVDSWKRMADEVKRQNYTDAETRELMSFAHEVAAAEQPVAEQPVVEQPVVERPAPPELDKRALADNKLVCDTLRLIGSLMHRDDVWTADASEDAQSVMDVLNRNRDVVKTMKERDSDMAIVTKGARFALNTLVNPRGSIADRLQEDPAHPFTEAVSKICLAIREFGNATTDEARKRACETIAGQIDVFVRGLSGWAQGELADNLDSVLKLFLGGSKNLPPGVNLKNADLLELAKSRHPEPRNETREKRKEREKAILADYSKLVMNPQAGGLGALFRSLGANYVSKLDIREKRAMIAGALTSVDCEMLTKVLGNESALGVVRKFVANPVKNVLGTALRVFSLDLDGLSSGDQKEGNAFDALKRRFRPGPDGRLPEALQDLLGRVAGGMLKGSGPVLQKIVQMLGAENFPPFLQNAVKDSKSNLKPIPDAYVDAKLKEIVRLSNGRIRSLKKDSSLGAASIAEAIRCKLVDSRGLERSVVVKMQRPDVRGRMEREIAAIRESVKGAGEVANRTLNARISSLLAELDFSVERANIKSCQDIYGKTAYTSIGSVKLAEGCPQLPDVLVMEEARGMTCQKYMDETAAELESLLTENKIRRTKDGHCKFTNLPNGEDLRNTLVEMYDNVRKRQSNLQRLVQVWFSNALFGDGKFHGDLHGGNIMVDPEGNLTVIDFGNAPTFAPKDRKNVLKMLVSAIRGKPGDLLAAVKSLVSVESQRELERNRATLVRRLNDLFAIGGIERAGARLIAVFGELARSGVEVPEALYNFSEAFGRIQQLSDSMTAVLERISGVVPYIRKHEYNVPAEYSVSSESDWDGESIERIIDGLLSSDAAYSRRQRPNITNREVLGMLKKKVDRGEYDRYFFTRRGRRPPFCFVFSYFSDCVSGEEVKSRIDNLHLRLDTPAHVSQATIDIQRWIHRCIKGILEPYCEIRPGLREPLDRLTKLLDKAYGEAYVSKGLARFFPFKITEEIANSGKDDEHFDEEVQFEKILTEISKDKSVKLNMEEKRSSAREIAELTVEFRKLMCDEVFPILADCYKVRVRQVLEGADMSRFPPPVSIVDSIVSSVKSNKLSAVSQVGVMNAIGFGLELAWNKLTAPEEVVVRANFEVKLARFREFAKAGGGRIHATKDKRIEATTYDFALTVHNAEARRALEESLLEEVGLSAEEFYRTRTGRRIAALLGLGKGETMNDVEKALPLTPELLRQVLAVFDMRDYDPSPSSVSAILRHFGITRKGTVLEDITYENFREKLDAACLQELGVPAAEAFGKVDDVDLTDFLKANYGKILKRMADIAGADPRFAKGGYKYVPGDVSRWLIGAFGLLKELPSELRTKFLGENAGAVMRSLGLPGEVRSKSPLYVALLLQAKFEGARNELGKQVRYFTDYVPAALRENFHKPPEQAILADEQNVREELYGKLEEGADETTRAQRAKAINLAKKLGLGITSVAEDIYLYRRCMQPRSDEEKQNAMQDLEKKVRTALYVWNERPPRTVDEEMKRIRAYWEAKFLFAPPPPRRSESGILGDFRKFLGRFAKS